MLNQQRPCSNAEFPVRRVRKTRRLDCIFPCVKMSRYTNELKQLFFIHLLALLYPVHVCISLGFDVPFDANKRLFKSCKERMLIFEPQCLLSELSSWQNQLKRYYHDKMSSLSLSINVALLHPGSFSICSRNCLHLVACSSITDIFHIDIYRRDGSIRNCEPRDDNGRLGQTWNGPEGQQEGQQWAIARWDRLKT